MKDTIRVADTVHSIQFCPRRHQLPRVVYSVVDMHNPTRVDQ